jgi:hypothetical protein
MQKCEMKYLLILILLLFGCVNENINSHHLIIGKWKSTEWNYYKSAIFDSDSSVVFDNHIDTLYRFKYKVDGDTLVLFSNTGIQYRTTIIKLTSDSLVLNGLEKRPNILRYGKAIK